METYCTSSWGLPLQSYSVTAHENPPIVSSYQEKSRARADPWMARYTLYKVHGPSSTSVFPPLRAQFPYNAKNEDAHEDFHGMTLSSSVSYNAPALWKFLPQKSKPLLTTLLEHAIISIHSKLLLT